MSRVASAPDKSTSTYHCRPSLQDWAIGISVWLMVFALCVPFAFHPAAITTLLFVGVIGLWRWLLIILHMLRAMAYQWIVFPAIRRSARAVSASNTDIGVICTSYRMQPLVNRSVARALRADIEALAPKSAHVIFSVGDEADAREIRAAFANAPGIELVILFQDGLGKRRAVADALTALRARIGRQAVVLLMDGDTLVAPGTLASTVSVLLSHPDVGALTVDNAPFVAGSAWTRDWYGLRMVQRHIQMCSLSLSERVLVLTGRWSLFQGHLALHPDFAAQVAHDTLFHGREGTIPLLTGEDKSTWRWVIERGFKAIYVPDVSVHPLEDLPPGNPLAASVALQFRWFGNMNRGGLRAIPLGPGRLGLFPWLILLDQRISMWTSLYGPVAVISAALLTGIPQIIAGYGLWVLLTRSIHALVLGATTGRWSPLSPVLLYWTQIVGSLVKIYVMFHPSQQKWSRQGIATGGRPALHSTALMITAGSLFIAVSMLASRGFA